jgi:alkanesulfonate monooxygenase SsuD/methylene tetrahydromethanopterin reductase-like flavin-dependent oxidoreductase (luciferase family)
MSPTQRPLELGMFVMPVHDPNKPMAQCFDEDLELAVQCEALGFDHFWVGEHHSSAYENIVMPEIFLGKVLGLTESMRIGPAPVCLQYHNPAHVASRLAFLDHLSHGRLNVCFGPGAVPTDMELYGIDPKDSGARVAEAIDIILKIWTSDAPYEIEGKFWNVTLRKTVDRELRIGSLHKPLQRPYPPIYVPSISRASAGLQAAAARGFRFISHHMVHPDVLVDQWKTYAQGAASAGRTAAPADWCVSRNIFVADTTREAKQLAKRNSLGRCIEYILELTRRASPTGVSMWKRNEQMADAQCNLDYFMEEVVIAGDPESVTAQLLQLRERIGPFGTLVLVAHDWDDRSHWLRSLELFSKEVVPAFNRAIAHSRKVESRS